MRKITHPKLNEGRIRGGEYGTDDSYGNTGAFSVYGPTGTQLRIIANDDSHPHADCWEHVSVSTPHRTPIWPEMCFVKDLFWTEEECVVQYHPPKSEHVNNHPYCLHLWRNTKTPFLMPPPIMVGIKEDGTYANKEEADAGMRRAIARGEFRR